jgi:transcriptional regulator with XRE-family HTH domain
MMQVVIDLGTLQDRLVTERELPPPALRRALRKACGVSLRQMAEPLGVTPTTILNWELGRRYPQPSKLPGYAAALRLLREEAEARLAEQVTDTDLAERLVLLEKRRRASAANGSPSTRAPAASGHVGARDEVNRDG